MDSVEFFRRLKSSKEGRKYLKLIEENKGKDRNLSWERGFERHHIQPRALGGSEDFSNLVKLTVFDHILAHLYLAKALPCYDTVAATCIMCGKQVKSLSEIQKISLKEVYVQANIRQLRRQFVKPKTEEENRHFVEQSKKTRIEKYGSLMKQAHKPEVIEKRLGRTASRYGGDSAGQLHTTESRVARKIKMVSKYGGCTRHMQTPEIIEKARKSRILHAQQSHEIMETEEYLKWFQNQKETTSKYRGVPKFLRSRNQTREEYLKEI